MSTWAVRYVSGDPCYYCVSLSLSPNNWISGFLIWSELRVRIWGLLGLGIVSEPIDRYLRSCYNPFVCGPRALRQILPGQWDPGHGGGLQRWGGHGVTPRDRAASAASCWLWLSPPGHTRARQGQDLRSQARSEMWQASRQALGGHSVGAMPYRGLLSHYLAPGAQVDEAGPGGDMTTWVRVTLGDILSLSQNSDILARIPE